MAFKQWGGLVMHGTWWESGRRAQGASGQAGREARASSKVVQVLIKATEEEVKVGRAKYLRQDISCVCL